jgi:asparagine synthase (glutamine-hydrolysing)
MNTLVAAWSLSERPLPNGVLDRMAAAATLLRPSRPCGHKEDTWGVVSRVVEGAGAAKEGQPVRSASTDQWIAFDGRIDNREQLIADLAIGSDEREIRESALALRAYRAWGAECAGRIVGDFALVVFDRPGRRLFCARDVIGVRTLFYAVTPQLVLVASSIRAILAGLNVTPDLDTEYFADFVADGLALTARTPYKGVLRLLPAHTLSVSDAGHSVVTRRYWQLPESPARIEGSEEEHQKGFLRLLTESVRCRLRAPGPIWAELSGGLDSTSLVCLAAEILGGDTKRLHTLTAVFDEASRTDERVWTRHVLDKYPLASHHIDGDAEHPFRNMQEAAPFWDEPDGQIPHYALLRGIADPVRDAGSFVLLSGIGAETVVMDYGSPPTHLADSLRTLRLAKLWRELLRWQEAKKVPLSDLFIDHCLKPLRFAGQVEHEARRRPVPRWVSADFAKRWDVQRRGRNGRLPRLHRSPIDQWQAEKLFRISAFLHRGYIPSVCEVRYPFLDRPLIEYAFGLPWSERIRPTLSKPLLRESLRGVLPEPIRTRRGHTTFGHSFYLSVQRASKELGEMFDAPIAADLGIVEPRAISDALALARCGHAPNLSDLGSVIALEAWLRWNYARSTPAAGSSAPSDSAPTLLEAGAMG